MFTVTKIITSLLMLLLPAAVLFRDWKYKDTRTKNHHQITRAVLVTWLICGLMSTGLIWYESYQSNQLNNNLDRLREGNDLLLTQNQKLLSLNEGLMAEIAKYQDDIQEHREAVIALQEFSKGKFEDIEAQPNFDQNMWSMITGIQSSIFKEYHRALDFYDQKNYESTAKTIQDAIHEYEKVQSWNFKGMDSLKHKEKASEFYVLSAKANGRLGQHAIAYKHAGKAKKLHTAHYTWYSLSVAAYNIKNYQESLNCIIEAIKAKPDSSKPDISVYLQIKEKCSGHLNKEDSSRS